MLPYLVASYRVLKGLRSLERPVQSIREAKSCSGPSSEADRRHLCSCSFQSLVVVSPTCVESRFEAAWKAADLALEGRNEEPHGLLFVSRKVRWKY